MGVEHVAAAVPRSNQHFFYKRSINECEMVIPRRSQSERTQRRHRFWGSYLTVMPALCMVADAYPARVPVTATVTVVPSLAAVRT